MDLLLSHILIMLGGKNDCIKTERLSVLIILNGNLSLSVRSKIRKSSILYVPWSADVQAYVPERSDMA